MEFFTTLNQLQSGYLHIGDLKIDPEKGVNMYNEETDELTVCLPE